MNHLVTALVKRIAKDDPTIEHVSDTRLPIKGQLEDTAIADIVRALAFNRSVKTLQLPFVPFEASGSYCHFSYLTETLETNQTLASLTLRVIPSDDAWTALCLGLQNNQSIQHLTLGDPRDLYPRALSATACYALGNVLQTSTVLETLTLHSFRVCHEKRLARGLRQNRALRHLELRHMEIGGLALILSALRHVPLLSLTCSDMDFELKTNCIWSDLVLPVTLEKFCLTECIVNASDLRRLCIALAKSNVEHCRLCGNDLLSDSTASLKMLPALRHLDLEENLVSNQGLETLCNDLCLTLESLRLKANDITTVNFPKPMLLLKSLDLSDNKIEDKGAKALAATCKLGFLPNLVSLMLDFCWITDEGVVDLVEGLSVSCSLLQGLGLGNNLLGTKGATALSRLIEGSNLSTLDVSSCHISDEAVKALVDFTTVPHALQELFLSFNDFGNIGTGAIASFLCRKDCGLKTLSIQFNHFDGEGVNDILNALQACNTSLQEFFYWTSRCGQLRQANHRQIDHWLALNRAGRHLIWADDDKHVQACWPRILARAHHAYGVNGVYHLLKERPMVAAKGHSHLSSS